MNTSGSFRPRVDKPIPEEMRRKAEEIVRLAFEIVPALHSQFEVLLSPVIAEDSCAARDRRSPLGEHVWHEAIASLAAADETIETCRQLFHADVRPASSHFVLLRSVFETTTFARWLVDPDLTSTKRVERGVLAALEDHDQRASFEKSRNRVGLIVQPPSRWGDEERDALIAEAEGAGFFVRDPHGRLRSPMNATDRCKMYLLAKDWQGDAVYRLASAFAHGKRWTTPFHERELLPNVPAIDGSIVTNVSAHPLLTAAMTHWAIQTQFRALLDAYAYMGAEPPRVSIEARRGVAFRSENGS
jgi:hypothetical protein